MSLGNDPDWLAERQGGLEEPPTYDCRHCPGQTHDPNRICPDCAFELKL